MYLRTILKRDDEELTQRVFREQERNTTPGDFVELVKADLEKYNIDYNEEFIKASKEDDFKSFVRNKIKEAAFEELKRKQMSHSKVNEITYEKLEKQPYLTSALFSNDDVEILSNLRSHTTRGIRSNFSQLYKFSQ